MKAILLLSLLFVCVFTEETAPVAQSNDIIDIIKCFIGKEEIITDIKDIIEIIKSGDYSKLITIAFKVYADVTAAIKECVPQEIELQGTWTKHDYDICRVQCGRKPDVQECRRKCTQKYNQGKRPHKPCPRGCHLRDKKVVCVPCRD